MKTQRILASVIALTIGLSGAGNALAVSPKAQTKAVISSKLSTEIRTGVENDILGMQKDAVSAIRSLMKTYTRQDLKETGTMKWSLTTDSGKDGKANFEMKLDKYTSLVSYLKGEQEFGAKWSIKIDYTGSHYDYTATGVTTKDEFGFPTYPKVPTALSANVAFDANVKIVKGDVYFTVSEFSVDRTGTEREVKEFDSTVDEIKKYVGKTYMVPVKDAGLEDPASAYKNIETVLSVLETKPLFEVQSSKGEVYTLRVKRSTIQALNLAMGKKKNAKVADGSLEKSKAVLTYERTSTGGILKLTDKKNGKNFTQIQKANGEYTLDARSFEQNRRFKTKSETVVQVKKNFFSLQSLSSSPYSKSKTTVLWKDANLDVSIVDGSNSFAIKGPLDIWTGTMDLKVTSGGKEYASIKVDSNPDTGYSFKVWLEFDFFAKIRLDGEGAGTFEHGDFNVTVPTEFEVIK